jgi:osmotically-inducible protein OsmY
MHRPLIHHFRPAVTGGSAALIALLLIAGCSQQTVDSASADARRNAAVVEREAKRAERKARPQLGKLDRGARVTAALRLNKRLPTSIRVDASENGVRLRGSVGSEEEKELAGRVARDTLGENAAVENELRVEEGAGDASPPSSR